MKVKVVATIIVAGKALPIKVDVYSDSGVLLEQWRIDYNLEGFITEIDIVQHPGPQLVCPEVVMALCK